MKRRNMRSSLDGAGTPRVGGRSASVVLAPPLVEFRNKYRPPARHGLVVTLLVCGACLLGRGFVAQAYDEAHAASVRASHAELLNVTLALGLPRPTLPHPLPCSTTLDSLHLLPLLAALLLAPALFLVSWHYSTPRAFETLRARDRLAEAALYDDYRRFRCSVGAGSIGVLVALAALIAADVPIFFASVRRQADCAHAAAALRHAAALAGDPLSAAHAHELAEMVAPLTASEWEVSWALSVGCLLWLGAFAALQLPVVEVEVLDVSRRMAVVPLSMLQETYEHLTVGNIAWEAALILVQVVADMTVVLGGAHTLLARATVAGEEGPPDAAVALLRIGAAKHAAFAASLLAYAVLLARAVLDTEPVLTYLPRCWRHAPFWVPSVGIDAAMVVARLRIGVLTPEEGLFFGCSLLLAVRAGLEALATAHSWLDARRHAGLAHQRSPPPSASSKLPSPP